MSICRALLAEGVPLKDFRKLAEAMVESAAEQQGETYSLDPIVDGVRKRIGSLIIQSLVPINMPLPVMTLNAELERLLTGAVSANGDTAYSVEPSLANQIVAAFEEAARPIKAQARGFAIVTSPGIRSIVKDDQAAVPGNARPVF